MQQAITDISLFKQYEKMIYAAAHRFARRNPHMDIDDLIGAGHEAFMHTLQKWDPSRAGFGTLLYRVLQNDLYDYVMRETREPCAGQYEEVVEELVQGNMQDGALWLASIVGQLGSDAREMVRVLFEEELPMHPNRQKETPANLAASLRRFFSQRNRRAPVGSLVVKWGTHRIQTAFNEVADVVALS